MLKVISLWFSWFQSVDFHYYLNLLFTSYVGYLLLIPIVGSVVIGLLHVLRR